MSGKDNGNGPNGHEHNITHFPNAKERAHLRAVKKKEKRPPKPPSEPILNLPLGVKILSAILLIVHIIPYALPAGAEESIYYYLAFIPAIYETPLRYLPQALTAPLTHSFLHAGWLHLLINLAMLMAFGSAIEKFIGLRKFFALFFITAFAGAFFHLAFFWGSLNPLVGASGGISGLFGGLLRVLQNRGHMRPGWPGLMPIVLLWIGISILFAVLAEVPGQAGQIAWTAHVGGFLAGLVLFPWINRKF